MILVWFWICSSYARLPQTSRNFKSTTLGKSETSEEKVP
jgi:hypothetical protein